MDKSITKGLTDKLYEKRKATALELEKIIKKLINDNNWDQIDIIINELSRDFTYALHQPTSRIAGLIGLAAISIALGINHIGKFLNQILPPVLACFGDQNDQVRFYACESLYNIAKISKGEILSYFNEIFDILCKITTDSENSVKSAAELLDRLIKDIVSEKASNFINIVNNNPNLLPPATTTNLQNGIVYQETYQQNDNLTFSLPKLMPLLTERIYVINPDTRIFLVDWLKVLLITPGLELISFLPSFLSGLFTFLGDTHKDVRTITHSFLNLLLAEIERIFLLKKDLIDKKLQSNTPTTTPTTNNNKQNVSLKKLNGTLIAERKKSLMLAFNENNSNTSIISTNNNNSTTSINNNNNVSDEIITQTTNSSSKSITLEIDPTNNNEQDTPTPIINKRDGQEYIIGQDIKINFPEIIEILVNNLASSESEIQIVALKWIDSLLSLSHETFIPFLANILSLLLKLIGDSDERISNSALNINKKFRLLCTEYDNLKEIKISYGSILNSLALQFFDGKIDAKIACLDWLLLIYRHAPSKTIDHNESMFLTLLTALSDNDARLIDRALNLIRELCSEKNESYLKKFLIDLLNLFKRDLKLFKKKGNYIMKQLCTSLSPETIYSMVSDIINNQNDIILTRMMIQVLSTNLITATEVKSLRDKLRLSDDHLFFNSLFKSWCHNPISVISLCLISENYELAYNVLQSFANYDLTVTDLLQLDILVQLLESPIFTRMRLQLLENQKYPYLYKCLYGILMILPQSKAFDILNKRLSSLNGFPQTPISSLRNLSSRSTSPNNFILESSSISSNIHRLDFTELLDYFNKIRSSDEKNVTKDLIFDTKVLAFDNDIAYGILPDRKKTPTTDNSHSHNIITSNNNNRVDSREIDIGDNNSVIIHSSTTSNHSHNGI